MIHKNKDRQNIEEFKKLADKKGLLKPGVKAGEVVKYTLVPLFDALSESGL